MRRRDTNFIIGALRYFLCGGLIGAGAILPGVSGGVLAVVFGIYRPFMEVLTHPRSGLARYWRLFLPLGLGGVVGFFAFAKGISAALHLSSTATTWGFIGLIVGTVPTLYRQAGEQGRNRGSWLSLALCAGAMLGGLFYANHAATIHLNVTFWSLTLCGALLGLGVVVPGMSASSILMALDLYQPLIEGFSELNVVMMACLVPGLVVTVAVMAHLVSWVFRTHHSIAFHGILGIVLASTVVIVPLEYAGAGEMGVSALCAGAGFLLAYFMGRMDRRLQGEKG